MVATPGAKLDTSVPNSILIYVRAVPELDYEPSVGLHVPPFLAWDPTCLRGMGENQNALLLSDIPRLMDSARIRSSKLCS